jgi:CheY-like chemotaxis protein
MIELSEAYRLAESVLVVDVDQGAGGHVSSVPRARGYQVLSASTADAGLRLADDPERSIDLLLADLRMTEMSGPELAGRLLEQRPSMAEMYSLAGRATCCRGNRSDGRPLRPQTLFARGGWAIGRQNAEENSRARACSVRGSSELTLAESKPLRKAVMSASASPLTQLFNSTSASAESAPLAQ